MTRTMTDLIAEKAKGREFTFSDVAHWFDMSPHSAAQMCRQLVRKNELKSQRLESGLPTIYWLADDGNQS